MSMTRLQLREDEASRALQEHEAEERRLNATGRKAKAQLLEQNLLDAQEARLTEEAEAENEVRLRYIEHQDAMDELVTALTAYVDAREKLGDLEVLLKSAEGRARRAGVEVPIFDSLSLRARRENDLRNVLDRAQRAIVYGGWLGAR